MKEEQCKTTREKLVNFIQCSTGIFMPLRVYVVTGNKFCSCVSWYSEVTLIYGYSCKFITTNPKEVEGEDWQKCFMSFAFNAFNMVPCSRF